ncbi:MAG: DUF4837 family protein [Parabacteroides sp.]
MRIVTWMVSVVICLLGLVACESSPVVTQATGLAYEVVVVMEKPLWDGELGNAVHGDLTAEVVGLPQSEPSMRVTYVQPKDFNGLLKLVRNILIVKVDPTAYTKVSMAVEENAWANNQQVVRLSTPDVAAGVAYLQQNPRFLSDFFTQVEMKRAQAQLRKEYSTVVMEHVQKDFDIRLYAPARITFYKDTTDFFWASNNANTGRTDLVVYSFPYTDPNTFTMDYLVAKRDSVLRAHLPGSFPGSFMTTEKRAPIQYEEITVGGQYCGVVRGLWRMEGDMMGGPFVSHAQLDEANNRVVVVEGFVYAPETDKRNFLRRIEAALFTLEFNSKKLSDSAN